jgi:tungstate transport system ATP-binding protein
MMDGPLRDEHAYRLRNVRFDYGARPVLDVAALELPCGQTTALVGPNGAGKTTLLRLLAFLLPPSGGVIELNGRAVSGRGGNLSARRREVTFVGQSPLLFHRSVRANVAYGLRARGLPDGKRVEAALAAVGLAGFADRPAWKLSGGETQRVAIARALAIDPPIYLFDEPTASVDREHVAVIESLIAGLGAAHKTVILTTHNLEQAFRLSDSVLSLMSGRVTAAPLLNVLRGTSTRRDGVVYFESSGVRIEIANGTASPAAPRVIAIDPEDIVVSRAPLHSSARNCLPGQIVKVERDERGILVSVDCGPRLMARITRHSYDELGLNIGQAVFATFKSSAIHVLGEAHVTEGV